MVLYEKNSEMLGFFNYTPSNVLLSSNCCDTKVKFSIKNVNLEKRMVTCNILNSFISDIMIYNTEP